MANKDDLRFGEKTVNKREFHMSRKPIDINKVKTERIVLSKKHPFGKKCVKHFVGYRLANDSPIKPLLIKLSGGIDLEPLEIKLPSGFEHNKRIGRAEYLRAKIVNDGKDTVINLHGRKGAGVISSLTGADGIVEIPLEYESINKGDLLTFFPFGYRGL